MDDGGGDNIEGGSKPPEIGKESIEVVCQGTMSVKRCDSSGETWLWFDNTMLLILGNFYAFSSTDVMVSNVVVIGIELSCGVSAEVTLTSVMCQLILDHFIC